MNWEDKCEMVRLLNNLFVLGFDLTKCVLLNPLKECITKVQSNDFRTAMRLAAIQIELESGQLPLN